MGSLYGPPASLRHPTADRLVQFLRGVRDPDIPEVIISAYTSASAVNQSPCAFILKAALFADGSYEGDATAAAILAVPQIALEIQRRHLHGLMDSILDDPSQDDAAKLARIRSELSKLYEKPDPAILEQI